MARRAGAAGKSIPEAIEQFETHLTG